MTCLLILRTTPTKSLTLLSAAIFLLILIAPATPGQRRAEDDDKPLYQEYRGIQLGMVADEVRKRLGSPTDKSDEQDFFTLGESESAQIFYDKARKVMAISANFLQSAQNIPTPKVLFGADVAAKPDGSVYKMTRYPKAGYWLAYSKSAGDSPLITITLQRID